MAKPPKHTTPACQKLIRSMQHLERDAYTLGLHATGRKINDALREVGWEIARLLEKKQCRAMAQRPGSYPTESQCRNNAVKGSIYCRVHK